MVQGLRHARQCDRSKLRMPGMQEARRGERSVLAVLSFPGVERLALRMASALVQARWALSRAAQHREALEANTPARLSSLAIAIGPCANREAALAGISRVISWARTHNSLSHLLIFDNSFSGILSSLSAETHSYLHPGLLLELRSASLSGGGFLQPLSRDAFHRRPELLVCTCPPGSPLPSPNGFPASLLSTCEIALPVPAEKLSERFLNSAEHRFLCASQRHGR